MSIGNSKAMSASIGRQSRPTRSFGRCGRSIRWMICPRFSANLYCGNSRKRPLASHPGSRALLLDHLVDAQQERLGDGQAECLGGREVDDEIELGGLLDREVARLCPAQNLVDIVASAAEQVRIVCSVGH